MQDISKLLPFLIPLVVIQFALMITSLVHVLRHDRYRVGNRALWIVVSCVSFIGPIAYFAFGRSDE